MTGPLHTLSDVLSFIAKQKTDSSISQVALALSINRHSAAKYLTILHMLGQVELRSFGKVKLYRLSRRVPYSAIKEIWEGMVIGVDRSYLVKEVSGGSIPNFPYPPEKILEKSLLHMPEGFFQPSPVLESLQMIIEGKTTDPRIIDWHELDRWYIIKIFPCVFEDGSFGATLLISDVSEKKILKQDLARWKERYHALIREPFEMVLSLSPDKKINSANEAYLSLFQTTLERVIGTDQFITYLADYTESAEQVFPIITRDNPSIERTICIPSSDGGVSWKKWLITAIYSGDILIEYVVAGVDITERRILEQKISRYEQSSGALVDERNRYIHDLENKVLDGEELIKNLQKACDDKTSRYLNLIWRGNDYVWDIDFSESITACSPGFATLLGVQLDDLLGKSIHTYLIPDSILKLRLFFAEAKKDPSLCSTFELIFQAGEEQYFPVTVSGIALLNNNGDLKEFLLTGRDLSIQKEIEDNNQRKTQILEFIADFVGTSDARGRILFLNKQARRLLNIPDDQDLRSLNIFQFVSARSHDTVTSGISTAVQTGFWRGDSVIRSYDGEEIPVSQIIFCHESGIAQEISFSTIVHDKRESIFHEREIAQINSYNRSLIEASPDPMFTISMDGKIQDTNKAAETITGLRKAILIGKNFSDISSLSGQADSIILETLETGSASNHRLDIRHSKGHTTPVQFNGTIFRDEFGTRKGILATLRDISLQIKAESELRDSLQYYLTILDGLPGPIWRVTPEGKYDYFNQAWLEFRGKSKNEEVGEGWLSGIHSDDRRTFCSLFQTAMTDQVFFFHELRLLHHDGTYHWVKMYARPLFSPDHRFMGFIGSCYERSG